MSLFGGGNHGLRAQVPNQGRSRWVWVVFGGAAVILGATYLLAPYLPTMLPKTVEEKKEPPVTTHASNAVLSGAEWTYQAIMPKPAPSPVEMNHQPASAPANTPPAPTYQPKPTTPQLSAEERRRLAEEEARRKRAQQQEYEQKIKQWKPLTWGKESSKKAEPGQLITAGNYSLSPGELIPCETEPVLSNEAPGAFRAFVTSHVYDSKDHKHIIIPQGTEVNGQVGGKTIIFGDSRLPIEALSFKMPNGDWMKFGKVSVGDRYGTAGFTGEIDRHLWRIVGSIFIQSVLRGGTTALVANSYDQGVTDRMAGAAVAETSREGQQLTKQVMRTDPTITVAAGYGCSILLQEPIVIPKPYQVVSMPRG